MKILLAGGGTGGHIMPILAVVKQIVRLNLEAQFLWIGTKKGPEAKIARENKIEFKAVLAGKMRRYVSFWNFVDMVKLPLGVVQAYFKVKKFKPDVCFSKGGYVSVPTVIVCNHFKIPVLLHESDVIAGKANLFMAKYASKIALGFEEGKNSFKDFSDKIIITGNPVREEILLAKKEDGIKDLNLNNKKPVLLIIGGSQGAQKINDLIGLVLHKLLEKWQIIHVVGPSHGNQILGNVKALENDYHIFQFLDGKKMGEALSVSDLIISRAGANSLAEISALGKPAILIPYPFASSDHQKANAEIYAKNNAAVIINEKDLTSEKLLTDITSLQADKEKLETMHLAMLKMFNKDANNKLATEILGLAKSKNVFAKKNKKILVFVEGTILMHKKGLGESQEKIVLQVKNNEPSVKDFANYIMIGHANEKLKKWQEQGAKILYLTSRISMDEVSQIGEVLAKNNFPEGDLYYRKENQKYNNIIEYVKPDILIEDDCESNGGQKEMAITLVKPEIKNSIKSIVVKEFQGIDSLSDDVKLLNG
ncbi:MAG: undecaprenyldiphospho-muramoylpentapeptide beta-N-acetylglucosaminyltransferase [Patescibacteria group bacterium]|jgi:UDP-N-acetylglucosamine--N-acetylmuramyl-(pentapeptide) pyrophosphoryl-undecaprenol N-acetylglucosamine transferase